MHILPESPIDYIKDTGTRGFCMNTGNKKQIKNC